MLSESWHRHRRISTLQMVILYYKNSDCSRSLRNAVLMENHEAVFAGHFAPKKCLICCVSIITGQGCGQIFRRYVKTVLCVLQGLRKKPPLHCIPIGEPFECVGIDFKELDISEEGNRYALVFQDYLTKWPEVFL